MRILALILQRIAWLVPTLAGLVAVVFFISRVIPADPVSKLAGETASRAQIELLRQKLGLDRPLLVQLADYYRQLLSGDLGTSLFTTRPVWDDLYARLPATIELTIVAMIIAVVIGIPLGVVSALYRNTIIDHLLRIITVAGLAVASFWLALVLQLYFAMDLGWLPLQRGSPDSRRHRSPASTSSTRSWKATSRGFAMSWPTSPSGVHAGVSGAGDGGALHASRRAGNAAEELRRLSARDGHPVRPHRMEIRTAQLADFHVTQIGLLFGILLAGAVVIETVFQWPGIGAYAFEAILQSDYAAVMGFTVYAGAVFGIVNLVVDIGHAILDPRGAGA
jgi:peptide/nickel transport system permease protein